MSSRALIRQITLVLACLAIATVVLGLYGHALNVDASTFLVVGRGWVAGTPPYSGLWDHKPPGIYVLTAIASLIDRHGDGVLALRALSIGSIVVTALLEWPRKTSWPAGPDPVSPITSVRGQGRSRGRHCLGA